MVGYYVDDIDSFIKSINQEECFKIVFKDGIPEGKFTSPFRDDNNPGCFFNVYQGILYYVDFAESKTHLNCIEFLAKKDNTSAQEVVLNIIKGNKFTNDIHRYNYVKYSSTTKISIVKRRWSKKDKVFWEKYGITKAQLNEDGVVPIKRFTITKDDVVKTIYPKTISYGYILGTRIKIYSPYSPYKFINNCRIDTIGGTPTRVGELLIITKSYKDYRVIKNCGFLDVQWFQNEKVIPKKNYIINIGKHYDRIIVFYDNDETGIKGAYDVSGAINKYFPGKAKPLTFPSNFPYKDPSDFVKEDIVERSQIVKELIKNT